MTALSGQSEKGTSSEVLEPPVHGQPPDVHSSSSPSAADDLIEVDFSPKPENCDIEIDGKYVNGSPLKRRLQEGKEYKVRISKGGFKDWEGLIVPEKGLRITPELGASR